MYAPFRKTLRSLWQQFKRCTEIYPPLYYDRLRAWSPEGQQNISQEAWGLFEKANATTEEEAWEEWDGAPSAGFYGRFYGDPAGLEEFRQLAESAYLTVSEMDSTLVEGIGYYGWLDLLYEAAFRFPTPLLRCDFTQWGFDYMGTEEDFDERASKWSEGNGEQPSYPEHPCQWSLNHSLFISSLAVIQIILDPESALVVGFQLDDFPLTIQPRTGSKETAVYPTERSALDADPKNASTASTEMSYVFRCEGKVWYFRYPGDKSSEGQRLPDRKGFQHYAKILAAHPNLIDSLDIDPAKPESWDATGSWIREKDQDTYIDSDENRQPKGEYKERRTACEQFKMELEENLRSQEDQLSAAEAAGNSERAAELRCSIEQTQKMGKEQLLQLERPQTLAAPTPEEAARNRVRTAMYHCIEALNDAGMVGLAQHLSKHVKSAGTKWRYIGDIDWQF